MDDKLKLITTKDKQNNLVIAVKSKKPRLANMKEFIENLTDEQLEEVDRTFMEWAELWPKKEVK